MLNFKSEQFPKGKMKFKLSCCHTTSESKSSTKIRWSCNFIRARLYEIL